MNILTTKVICNVLDTKNYALEKIEQYKNEQKEKGMDMSLIIGEFENIVRLCDKGITENLKRQGYY